MIDKSIMCTFGWLLPLCLGALPLLAAPVFHVNPPRLPDATVGKAYTGGPLLLQGGGECPRNIPSVRVVAGSLPSGIYLSPGGQFGGGPLEAGRFEFVVRVENGCGWSDQPMAIEVTGSPVLLANPAALEFRVAQGQAVAPASVQVSGNSPGIAYTAESEAAWVRARARAGRTPGVGSALVADLIDVEIDTASLSPGIHRASIEIGGWRMAAPVIIPVRVEVLGATQAGQSRGAGGAGADALVPSISVAPPATATPLQTHPVVLGHATEPPARPAAASVPAPVRPAPRPTATPGRLSRSAQLRSKYLAAKPAQAHPVAADPHAKPSAMGDPVKKADHATPAQAAQPAAKPAAAEAHGKPAAADAHAKPAAPPPAKAPDTHGKPASAPAAAKAPDAHGKPADAHAKPAAPPAAAKPKEPPKH
jgi:hypothetical protein